MKLFYITIYFFLYFTNFGPHWR